MRPSPQPMAAGPRRAPSFSSQVALLVVAITVATGLVNWAAAGHTMSRLALAEVERSTSDLARSAADRIGMLASSGIAALSHAAADLRLHASEPPALEEAVRRIRADLAAEFPFDGLSFIDRAGKLRALDPPDPRLIGADLSDREYVRPVLATAKPYVSDAVFARTGRLIAVIAVPVLGPDGSVAGVLSGSLHLEKENRLARLLHSLEAEGGTRYVVLDRRGVVVYASGGTDAAGKPFSPDVLRRLAAGRGSVRLADRERQRWLGSRAGVPETGWSVLALVPERAAFGSVWRFHLQTAVVSLLTLAAAALVSLALSRRLTRPLHELIAALQAVARGRYDTRFADASTAEWRQLGEAFNRTVAELAEYQRLLNERACRDPLTGIFNRGTLNEHLERELAVARQTRAPLSLLMIDIDDFKQYNDTFGHPAGDEVLVTLGAIGLRSVRDVDLVARYGGEEFVVVLKEADCAAAVEVAERIRAAMAGCPLLRPVTVSIGIACFPAHGDTPEALIARADEALYAAKQRGKNRVVVHGGGSPAA